MIEIFKKFRDPNKRWYKPHREQAVALRRWLFPLLIGAFTIGIITISTVYVIGKNIYIKNRDIKLVMDVIFLADPDYDHVYAEASAKYLVEHSYPFDPVYLAWKVFVESVFDPDAISDVGARSYFQILETNKEKRARRRQDISDRQVHHWAYQLDIAKYDRLIPKYLNPYTGECKSYNRLHAMELDWFGCRTKKKQCGVDSTIVKQYTGYLETRGWIWQDKPNNNNKPEKESK